MGLFDWDNILGIGGSQPLVDTTAFGAPASAPSDEPNWLAPIEPSSSSRFSLRLLGIEPDQARRSESPFGTGASSVVRNWNAPAPTAFAAGGGAAPSGADRHHQYFQSQIDALGRPLDAWRHLQPAPLGLVDGQSTYTSVRSLPTGESDPTGLQAERDFTQIPKSNNIQLSTRKDNMGYCLSSYVKCQHYHGGSLLINGKRCEDCFNMCTLNGYWPSHYCPLGPF